MRNDHIVPIRTEWPWEREIPPAPGIRCGGFVFLSGQIAFSPEGALVGEGSIKVQAEQCFRNVEAILHRAGGSLRDIVKLVTYFACPLTDQVRQEYWAVRKQFFGDYSPASTGVQVAALIFPAVLVEVEAVAFIRDRAA